MRGSEVRFYADAADMRVLLDSINAGGDLRFTETLSKVGAPLVTLQNALELMRFLRTAHPEWPNIFLVTPTAASLNTQTIKMADGSGVKMKADQPLNPDAVLINLGGELKKTLIATSVNTTAETPTAKKTFGALKRIVMRDSEYKDGFYVLPGALRKLKEGWRLTPDPGFASSEDLKLE